jgi:hypothetical protein
MPSQPCAFALVLAPTKAHTKRWLKHQTPAHSAHTVSPWLALTPALHLVATHQTHTAPFTQPATEWVLGQARGARRARHRYSTWALHSRPRFIASASATDADGARMRFCVNGAQSANDATGSVTALTTSWKRRSIVMAARSSSSMSISVWRRKRRPRTDASIRATAKSSALSPSRAPQTGRRRDTWSPAAVAARIPRRTAAAAV